MFKILLVLILSFPLFAQRSFYLGDYLIHVDDTAHGNHGIRADEYGALNFFEVLSFKPVFPDKDLERYQGLILTNADDKQVYYAFIDNTGSPRVESIGIQIETKAAHIEEFVLKDADYRVDALKITYDSIKEGNISYYEKALVFYDKKLDHFENHLYLTNERADKIEPIRELEGEEVRLFKTGDSYIENPLFTHINQQSSSYFKRPEPKRIKLPDPPKRIGDFNVLTLDDFTDEEIRKAKDFVGTDDFYKILEGYQEGSVAILGESGEGKSFLAEQFYTAALAGYIPGFEIQEVLELTKSSLSSDTMYVGQSADKLEALKVYYKQGRGRRLIFADEVHTLKGAGTSEGDPVDHLQNLKTDMAKGRFKLVGTTTLDEFNGLVGGDAALERRFTKVRMTPKTHEEILNAVKYNAKVRDIIISDDIAEKIIRFSNEFDVAGVQPAKAVKLTVKSISKLKVRYPELKELNDLVLSQSVSELYNSDIQMLDPSYALNKTENLKSILDKKLIGVDQVKESLVEASKQRFLGMTDTSRPPLRMELVGPPGTGKSYSAKVYAEAMGFETAIISMNNYAGHATANMFLDEVASALRNNPDAVIILDEFEKASQSVKLAVLQMLNDGEFKQLEKVPGSQQTRSIKISSKRAGFILTSNIGDKYLKDQYTSILKIELEKTKDIKKAEAEATRVFRKMTTKNKLEKLLTELGHNTAALDRMDYIIAVPTPNHTEFRKNVELYTDLFLKDYQKRIGLKVRIKNYKHTINKVMTHFKPGMSNRDAQKMIDQIIKPQISKQLNAESLKQKQLDIKMPLDELKYVDPSPKTTQNLKKLITMHELHGHWLVNFMLYGENVSNFVTIIPGDGYLGYVRPKVNHDLISETMETFTGMFKKVIVLEAGYRAEKIIGGVTGRGAGSINRAQGKQPTDDLGKINQLYDRWINNNFFEDVIENHNPETKRKFKLQMAKIIGAATDYVIQKGLANGVGNEAVDKLLKDGKLHGEWLDRYANDLSKKFKFKPENILDEALDYALENISKGSTGVGYKPQSSGKATNLQSLIEDIREKLNMEKKFFSAKCNDYYTASN